MNKFNVIAVFCEDIRDERDGIISVMGILPDNAIVAPALKEIAQGAAAISTADNTRRLSKLCAYVRIHFDPDYDLPEAQMRLILPGGAIIPVGNVGDDIIQKAKANAKERHNPLAGLVGRVEIGGFTFSTGTLKLEVTNVWRK